MSSESFDTLKKHFWIYGCYKLKALNLTTKFIKKAFLKKDTTVCVSGVSLLF